MATQNNIKLTFWQAFGLLVTQCFEASIWDPEQAMLQVDVSFPSGCGETSWRFPQNSTVGELKVVAQKVIQARVFLKLVTEKEHVPDQS